ncbi:MAG: TIGR03084 family metal-binding protein [Pseudomonadota bacterium]
MTEDPATALRAVVEDLRTEGDQLYALLKDMDTAFWTTASTFKSWTVWDVVAHLHFSDYLALTSLRSGAEFTALLDEMRANPGYNQRWLSHHGQTPNGPDLLERWRTLFQQMCDALDNADPDARYVWVGPGMKARMFATARQMETWAHGWEVYDLMGVSRTHTDRIKNIATIGVRTYGWTFENRRLPAPGPAPRVVLKAPSGAIWEWQPENAMDSVQGDAVEFCQVVTQTRNIADTQLVVRGAAAQAWMAMAQCFAGPPEEPPVPGTRMAQ